MYNPRFKIAFHWQLLLIMGLLGMPLLAPLTQQSSAALPQPAPVPQTAFTFTIDDAEGNEVNTNQTSQISFPVRLDQAPPAGAILTVKYETQDLSAQQPFDYTPITGTLTFDSSSTERLITVTTLGNDVYRPVNLQFRVKLSDPQIVADGNGAVTSVTLARAEATGTIIENEPIPALEVSDVIVNEGTDQEAFINMTIRPAAGVPVRLTYALAPCSPADVAANQDCAIAGVDFTEFAQRTLTFGGSGSERIIIDILDDDVPEVEKVLFVRLFNPETLRFPNNQQELLVRVTIRDSDLSIARFEQTSYTVLENVGVFRLPVRLNHPPARGEQVRLRLELIEGGSAQSGSDFVVPSTPLVLNSDAISGSFNITIRDDGVQEPTESFKVRLVPFPDNPGRVAIGTPNETQITIQDDDGIALFSATGQTGSEGGKLSFTVRLNPASIVETQVDYSVDTGSDVEGRDFTIVNPLNGTLTFAAGNTRPQSIAIQTIDNDLDQTNRTYTLTLSNARPTDSVGIAETGRTAFIVVQDNDGPTITFTGASSAVRENAGFKRLEVRLSAPSPQEITVRYATEPMTAVAGEDYRSVNGTLTFTPGTLTQTIEVEILNNYIIDPNPRTFAVVLSNPVNGVLGEPVRHEVTITDDEAYPAVRFSAPEFVVETGQTVARITVSAFVTARPETDFSVLIRSRNGTALANRDYIPIDQRITFDTTALQQFSGVFTPTNLTKVITTTIIRDPFEREDRQFEVILSDPQSDAVLAQPSQAVVRIRNGNQLNQRLFLPYVQGSPTEVGFSRPTVSIREDAGVLAVEVSLSNAVRYTSTVEYRTLPQLAEAGRDYEDVSGVLTFGPGIPQTQTISVTIINNTIRDGNRNFLMLLNNAQGDIQLGAVASTSITIIDDDVPIPNVR